jgi:hypothetical protein
VVMGLEWKDARGSTSKLTRNAKKPLLSRTYHNGHRVWIIITGTLLLLQ